MNKWKGGKQPVASDVIVKVYYRNGFNATDRADAFKWFAQDDYDFDIVGYEICGNR